MNNTAIEALKTAREWEARRLEERAHLNRDLEDSLKHGLEYEAELRQRISDLDDALMDAAASDVPA